LLHAILRKAVKKQGRLFYFMTKREKVDTRDIGLQIGLIFGQFFLKTSHLHYGYWPEDLEVNIDNFPEAQKNYTNFLMSHISDDVKSILDVGCGVGENAEILLAKGHQVDCVSPSKFLSDVTRQKVGDRIELFECFFEDIQTEKKYDMILFSESFQYIKMDKAFQKCMNLLKDDGYILICDFFKIPGEGARPMGGGHRLAKFNRVIGEFPFNKIKEIDITEYTAPNIDLVDQVLRQVAMPIQGILSNLLHTNYKILSKISGFIAQLFFRKKLEKIKFKYFSGERNAENFKKFKRYYLFLYQKSNDS
jgi:SAM-dependent methyltransferase